MVMDGLMVGITTTLFFEASVLYRIAHGRFGGVE
jgi:hypothetical protein